MRSRNAGFTLIELLIAIVIVAILTAIAVPNYQEHTRRSRRSDAWTTLLKIQQLEEKWRANNTEYADAADIWATGASIEGYYTMAFSNITDSTYTITATPAAAGPQAADSKCPTIVLNEDGPKKDTDAEKACWK